MLKRTIAVAALAAVLGVTFLLPALAAKACKEHNENDRRVRPALRTLYFRQSLQWRNTLIALTMIALTIFIE